MLYQFHQLLPQPVLNRLVVVGEAVLLILIRHHPGDGNAGLAGGGVEGNAPLLTGIHTLSQLDVPIVPAAHLRVHQHMDDDFKNGKAAEQNGQGDQQAFDPLFLIHRTTSPYVKSIASSFHIVADAAKVSRVKM